MSLVSWFKEHLGGEKADVPVKPRLQNWSRSPGKAPGQVSEQTYALSTGKTPPKAGPVVLQSRVENAWRDRLLSQAAEKPPTEQWKQENIWKAGEGPRTEPLPELNSTNRALLEALGWTVPGQTPAAEEHTLDNLLDLGKAQTLKAHSYSVGRPELELLQMAAQGKKGVIEGEGLVDRERRVGTGEVKAVPLTQEAYENLNADQKRAVDFNTMFLQAREKDLSLENEEGRGGEYDEAIEKLFGKEGGSETYAPSTVDLLKSIGYEAKGQDLDEYLSLDRLISVDELANFKTTDDELKQGALTPRSVPGVELYTDVRSTTNQMIADAALVEKAGAFIDEAMKNNQAWDVPSAATFALTGAAPTGSEVPWGYGTAADRQTAEGVYAKKSDEYLDQDIRDAYSLLQQPDQNISSLWAGIQDAGMDEDDIQKMFNAFDLKSKRDAAIGVLEPGLRTPNEIRKMLGLEG